MQTAIQGLFCYVWIELNVSMTEYKEICHVLVNHAFKALTDTSQNLLHYLDDFCLKWKWPHMSSLTMFIYTHVLCIINKYNIY